MPTRARRWETQRALAEFARCSKEPKGVALLRAGLLAGNGKLDEARAMLEAALPTLPADQQFDVSFEIAQLDLQSGRRDAGLALLRELSKLRPSDLSLLE